MTAGIDPSVFDDLSAFRYRERFHLSAREVDDEPYIALAQARVIWELDNKRDMLELERQKQSN